MRLERPDRKLILKYILLQIPSGLVFAGILFLLQGIFSFSHTILFAGILLWFVKDAVLFPLVWRSYHVLEHQPGRELIGKYCIVTKRIDPEGMVRLGPELWRARLKDETDVPIDTNRVVRVHAVEGLLLVVHPENPASGFDTDF